MFICIILKASRSSFFFQSGLRAKLTIMSLSQMKGGWNGQACLDNQPLDESMETILRGGNGLVVHKSYIYKYCS